MSDEDVIALAERCGLGKGMRPIGVDTGSVFRTEAAYRTAELFAFADHWRRLIAEAEERATERAAILIERLIADGVDQSYFASSVRTKTGEGA